MLTNITRSATSLSTSAEAALQHDKNDVGLCEYLPYSVITAFVCVCVCVCVDFVVITGAEEKLSCGTNVS